MQQIAIITRKLAIANRSLVTWVQKQQQYRNDLQRSLKVIKNGIISEIKRDIGRKSWFFFILPLHSTPPLGGSPSEYCHPVWYGKKLEWWGYPRWKKLWDMCNRLGRILACDRQTDGRTDILRRRFWTNILLYLRNSTRQSHSYYGKQMGNRTQGFEWCHFQWLRVTWISRSRY